jgi:lipoprotein-anchoring transpeptidase ErfK/SrfK
VRNFSPQRTRTWRNVAHGVMAVTGSVLLLTTAAVAGPTATGAAGSAVPATVASVSPASGETVGVAEPVTVTFTGPVADRRAAEKSLVVTPAGGSAAAAGSFAWLDNRVLQWTPSDFYPAHAPIDVSIGGFQTSFHTGSSVVGVADVGDHTFTVSIDGVVARQMPASMGKPKHPTPIGQFTALSKERTVTFDSRTIGIPLDDPEGYLIKGEYGVRVTWGGVYVHSAPWSVGSQGYANVSHGCINLSPDNAAWYFDTVSVGDPIIVQA